MEHAVSAKHMVHSSSWSGTAGEAEMEETRFNFTRTHVSRSAFT